MKTITFYAKHSRLDPASRIRFFQFIPKLEKYYLIKTSVLFPDDYIPKLFAKIKQNRFKILYGYISRFITILFDHSDLHIVQRELFPYVPYFIEKLCLFNKKYIIDIDDADYYRYTHHRSRLVQKLLSNKFNLLLKHADCVMAGNEYLAQYAQNSGAKKVIYFPTVIDLNRYKILNKNGHVSSGQINIGWIGSNQTIGYVQYVVNILEQLAKLTAKKITLHIIGADKEIKVKNIEVRYFNWSEESEVELISKFDIGIMPLKDTEWEKGKCAYKLVQYMGCAKPVVASAVGANKRVVINGINGFLCHSDQEWIDSMLNLINSDSLRLELGKAGRANVEEFFSLDKQAKQFCNIIDAL